MSTVAVPRVRALLMFAAAMLPAACRDLTPGAPKAEARTEIVAVPVVCAVHAADGTGQCVAGAEVRAASRDDAVQLASATLRAMPTPAAKREGFLDAVLGGAAIGVQVFDVQQPTAGSLRFQLAVRNQLDQPIGFTAVSAIDPNGVRVFVESAPTAIPTGTATVDNPTGTGTLRVTNTPFFDYGTMIVAGDEAVRAWRVTLADGAQGIAFRVLVVAETPFVGDRLAAGAGQFADVSRTENATCAQTRAGALQGGGIWCWGLAQNGSTGRPAPQTFVGLGLRVPVTVPGDVQSVALPRTAQDYAYAWCALRLDGRVVCRGQVESSFGGQASAFSGQDERAVVLEGQRLTSVVMGSYTICGLDAEGLAWCRGLDYYGALGRGTTGFAFADWGPVEGFHRFSQLTGGEHFVCGLLITGGTAVCWGDNSEGQLGRGRFGGTQSTPRPVLGGRSFVQLSAAGEHVCGRESSGNVYCWGIDYDGQNGNGVSPNGADSLPLLVLGGHSFVHVEAGPFNTCGITSAGDMRCWGDNSFAQLGSGYLSVYADSLPRLIPGGHTWGSVSIGAEHLCGRTVAGQVRCWGNDSDGQLGRGNPSTLAADLDSIPQPVAVASQGFTGVASGGASSCAWRADASVVCWGFNSGGGGGPPPLFSARASPEHLTPTGILTRLQFRSISAGPTVSCGVTTANALWCWGQVTFLSSGTPTNTPVQVLAGESVRAVSVGRGHACATTTTGAGWCWGINSSRQIGDNTFTNRPTPVLVSGSHVWRSISVGTTHTCGVIETTRVVRCWGTGINGQLGTNAFPSSLAVPTAVFGGYVADTVVLGNAHTCGLVIAAAPPDSGGVSCWGYNAVGQLGVLTANPSVSTPQLVIPNHRFDRLAAGGEGTCGRTLAGSLMCWGRVYLGSGGFGIAASEGPELAFGGATVRRFAMGGPTNANPASVCAVMGDGTLRCVGEYVGQRATVWSPTSPPFPTP
jgi:alpha-tubulin suppressor-like RCC1 family protein